FSLAERVAREDVDQESLIRADAEEGECPERLDQAIARLQPILPVRDHLREERVVVRVYGMPLLDPGVHANPLARRPCEERDRAALRDEAAIRVLGVQPHLDGVPLWLRPLGELSAGGDLDLRPYE